MASAAVGESENAKSNIMPFLADLAEVEKERKALANKNENYSKALIGMMNSQKGVMEAIRALRYKVQKLRSSINKAAAKQKFTEREQQQLRAVKGQLLEIEADFDDFEQALPHKNGLYLRVVIGDVNVSLLSKSEKYNYKKQYEEFKLIVNIVSCVMTVLFYSAFDSRVADALLHFMVVWYYCTLTIREQILIVNGSRIGNWWVLHHFVSTVCGAFILIWPDSRSYREFRPIFFGFAFYTSVVQFLQYYYQSGQLYRMRALGESHQMDVTADGFHSWMRRGLGFLIPFLIAAYIFELHIAYVLWNMSNQEWCNEWHVRAIAIVFVILFCGNTQALIGNLIGRVHTHTQRTMRYRRRWSTSGQMRRGQEDARPAELSTQNANVNQGASADERPKAE